MQIYPSSQKQKTPLLRGSCLNPWGGKDYKKMKMRDFIKGFDAMTDVLIKLKMNQ